MQTGLKPIMDLRKKDRLEYKKKLLSLTVLLLLLMAVSLCIKNSEVGWVSPMETFANMKAWIHITLGEWFHWPISLYKFDVIDGLPNYYETVSAFKIALITLLCGMLLSMSGCIFQGVFRNPIAAPTMLGVSTGVELGILILVLTYGTGAYTMPLEKYLYCYIGAALSLTMVIAVGKLASGKGRFSVIDLLLVGAIISQIAGAVLSYFSYAMDDETLLVYREISSAIYVNTDPVSFYFLGGAFLISMVPMYLVRFSFNALCFDNDQSFSMGINPRIMRFAVLILGTLMITAAMVHCGAVGMISLIVPHLSRYLFGAEFRNLFWGNLLIGGILLVLCRDIASMFYFGYNGNLPIGVIVSLVAAPIFVIMMVNQKRGWE